MSDPAHRETDRLIKEIERRLSKEYKKAEREIAEKLFDYLRRFLKKDETWQKWVSRGLRTQKEYDKWRVGQMAIGKRWEEMRETLATDYHNVNLIAKSIVNGYMPEVYALNHNYGTFQVEQASKVDTSYSLYNRQAVERIIKKNPDLLPPPGRDLASRIAAGLDIKWNRQQIQSTMIQGLLQGEPIPALATRLADTVGDKNRKSAIRNARTMATGAQNAGRLDSYDRAQRMGIKLNKQWLATLDSRTRHTHRALDGQTVPIKDPFEVDGMEIMYPGDPEATPALVWNCRCTMKADLEGFEDDLSDLNLRRSDKLGSMTYQEWKESHVVTSNPIDLPERKAEAFRWSYINEYRRG